MKSIKFDMLDKLYDTINDMESLGHLSGPHADTAAIESSNEAMPVTNDSACIEEAVKSKSLHGLSCYKAVVNHVFSRKLPIMLF